MCSSRNINEGNLSSLLLATNKRWRKFKSASSWTASRSCNGKLLTPKATPETRQQPEGAALSLLTTTLQLQNVVCKNYLSQSNCKLKFKV